MRITQTYILRLLVDPEHPCELRGVLHCVADNSDYTFADAETLLAQLRYITSLGTPSPADEDEGATSGTRDE